MQTEATSSFRTRESALPQESSAKDGSKREVLQEPSCLVCGRTRLTRVHRTPHQVLLRCDHCRLVFGWPVFSREVLLEYNAIAFRGEGFPETAGYFDRSLVGLDGSSLLRQYRRGLEQISRVVPSGRLLDVGCGVPIFLDLARSAGYTVQGIDSVPEIARIARDDFDLLVDTAPFDRCGLEGASFDVITMWDFLEHLPDPVDALMRSQRLLRPGGVLFVSVPNHRSVLHGVAAWLGKLPYRRSLEMVDKLYHFSHVCVWSPRSIETALTAAGFSPLARGLDGPDLSRYRIPPHIRAGLTAVDVVGRLTGLRSRLWILARTAGSDRPGFPPEVRSTG